LKKTKNKNTSPFTIGWKKKKKYLEVNLTKQVPDLHHENYKILMKETKEVLNKWRRTELKESTQ
jgi:hypothetical protein